MSKAEYIVVKETVCDKCCGSGWVEHPRWVEFYNEFPVGTINDDETRRKAMEWWNDAGFTESPDPDLWCDKCEGTGKIVERVSLMDALISIGVVVKV